MTAARTFARWRTRLRRANFVAGIAGVLWLAVVVVPLYWIVITSFRSRENFFDSPPLALPSPATLDNYHTVLAGGYFTYLWNSLLVTVATVGLTLAVALPAAHAIVHSTRRRVQWAFQLFLLGLAIPLQATIIPVYLIISKIGAYDTLWGLVLPGIAFSVPLTVIILVNFLRDIPRELYEAMRLDGARQGHMLLHLSLPLSRPALITVMVYDALNIWNGFLFPLILTQSPDQRVLPIGVWNFQGEFNIDVPTVLAYVVLSTIPVVALYAVGRRYLVSGLTAGFGR
jgi:raffinose/stachyose/melibiose transport system permease protein